MSQTIDARLAGLSPQKRALLLQQLAKQAPSAAKHEIGRRPRPARIPLSSAQQRLWILDRIDPGSAVYNVPSAMWLRGRLDRELLSRALTEVLRRHESLRTVIAADEEGPHQIVLPATAATVATASVAGVPLAERHAAALAEARVEAAAPFDIARGPLLRALLVELSGEEHLLVLNAHHIAVDGWSLGILYDELAKLYAAFHAGLPSPLPELPIQYVDYALWQHEELAGESLAKQLDYWRERLSGRLPVLEIPGDRPRPAQMSYRGEVLRTVLDVDGWEAVKRFSRAEGVTPFMTLFAAYQTLLARYSGQTDLVVGVGVANRRRQELEPLVGFFVNTLAPRTDLSGNPSFRVLLARVKEATLGAYSNQDLPIEKLIENLDLDRALSHAPLFQTLLFFQNFKSSEIELPGLTLVPMDFDQVNPGTARADLSLFASDADGALVLAYEYATDLFDRASVEAFAAHLRELLRGAIAAPDTAIGALPLLTAVERRQLTRDWNATERALPAERLVHRAIAAQAARTPDAIALEQHGRTLRYAELERRADALAAALVERGIGAGDRVGLFVERTPDLVVGLLGVLKAGAAYVPMDPSYPAQRLAYMLEDAGMRVIVSERALSAALPPHEVAVVLIDALPELAATPFREAHRPVDPEDPAYVIFTSGSTGRPKGVEVPHRAVVNFLASMAREPGLGAADTLCAVTTLSFDIAVLELLLPLTVGARIVLADRATASDGAALARLLESSQATAMQATPATWRMLLDAGWRGNAALRVFCGGEGLPRELADRLLGVAGELWNLYGPTETTVWSTVERVLPGAEPITIGRPLDNTEVYVVDRRMQLLPPGVPGELLIGGLGVARGYLARPELTAEKFIPDAFGPRPGHRLYRTGDLARRRRDGRVEVIGRIDHQVKLRGFRIELGEIEAVLDALPVLRQSVVVCREDRPGDKRLVAYVVARDPAVAPDTASLRAELKTRLPDYMLPSAILVLAELPLTPNGKVDRRALPAPEGEAGAAAEYVAPRSAEEENLAALWAEVLGRERVGIHDDFFDLGGHSLLATQLIARVQKCFGGEVPLRLLFEAPTVAAFAERLLAERAQGIDAGALAGMLDQLEGLSDDDIAALLETAG